MKNAIEVCFSRVSLVGIGTKSLWGLSDTPCKLQFKISPPRGEKAENLFTTFHPSLFLGYSWVYFPVSNGAYITLPHMLLHFRCVKCYSLGNKLSYKTGKKLKLLKCFVGKTCEAPFQLLSNTHRHIQTHIHMLPHSVQFCIKFIIQWVVWIIFVLCA